MNNVVERTSLNVVLKTPKIRILIQRIHGMRKIIHLRISGNEQGRRFYRAKCRHIISNDDDISLN